LVSFINVEWNCQRLENPENIEGSACEGILPAAQVFLTPDNLLCESESCETLVISKH